MSKTTNSAQRLYEILKEAREYRNNNDTTLTSVLEVWSNILGAKSDSIQDLSDKFFGLIHLIKILQEDIIKISSKRQSRYIDAISRLQFAVTSAGLSQDYASWDEFLGKSISEDTMTIIELCSEEIEEQGTSYNLLSSEEYDNFIQKLRQLIDEFANSDLPTDIKYYFIEELEKLEKAIRDIYIRGEGNLINVTEEIIGSSILKSWRNPGKYREYFSKIISFAAQVNGSINLGEKIAGLPTLTEAIQKLLPPG